MDNLNQSSSAGKNKLSLADILIAIKELTFSERRVIEKELVLMRLGSEFNSILDKFEKRRIAKKGGEFENA